MIDFLQIKRLGQSMRLFLNNLSNKLIDSFDTKTNIIYIKYIDVKIKVGNCYPIEFKFAIPTVTLLISAGGRLCSS